MPLSDDFAWSHLMSVIAHTFLTGLVVSATDSGVSKTTLHSAQHCFFKDLQCCGGFPEHWQSSPKLKGFNLT